MQGSAKGLFLRAFFTALLFGTSVVYADLEKIHIKDTGPSTVRIEMSTTEDIKAFEFLPDKNHRNFKLFLHGVNMKTSVASVPTLSRFIPRIKLERQDSGILVAGRLTRSWSSYVSKKDDKRIQIEIRFKDDDPLVPQATSEPGGASLTPVVDLKPDIQELENLLKSLGPLPGEESTEAIESPFARKIYTGKPISLDLVDANLKNVIRLLAEIVNMNIIIDQDVKGSVTLRVENVPWDQIFDMILKANDLGMEKHGNVIRVARKDKLRKELEEQEKLIEKRKDLIEKQAELSRKRRNMGPMETAYLVVNYGDIEKLKDQIDEAIKSDDGKIDVDTRTRTIIFTDYRPRIEEAKKLIAALDKPTDQVLLDAKIVEIARSYLKSLGVTWSFSYENQGNHRFRPHFEINTPVTTNTGILGLTWGLLKGQSAFNLDFMLKAGVNKSLAKIISAPKVHTMNNSEATISQGMDIPYKTLDEAGNTITEFKRAELRMTVTPIITPDGRVDMKISIKKDSPMTWETGEEPPIRTSDIKTELLVDDGAVVVLGGILEKDESQTRSRVPGLASIPIFGNLFRNRSIQSENKELFIFIRPKIIELPSIHAMTENNSR